ncbi:MAG: hypothetical protein KatS3mg022_0811 [Armatimonadota bacterium]|nr:MAG: hypothetical protein KatS3mg022_0811 [Armatimonadota bacterium]
MLKRLWGVTLLLVLASNLCWAQYRLQFGGVCGVRCAEGTDEPGMGECFEDKLSMGKGRKHSRWGGKCSNSEALGKWNL